MSFDRLPYRLFSLPKKNSIKKGVMIGLFIAPMWVNFLLRMMATKAVFNVLNIKLGMGTVIFGLTSNSYLS